VKKRFQAQTVREMAQDAAVKPQCRVVAGINGRAVIGHYLWWSIPARAAITAGPMFISYLTSDSLEESHASSHC